MLSYVETVYYPSYKNFIAFCRHKLPGLNDAGTTIIGLYLVLKLSEATLKLAQKVLPRDLMISSSKDLFFFLFRLSLIMSKGGT